MTKAEWISYIKNHLKRVDETNKYHPVVIEKTIDTIYSQMFSELYGRGKRGIYKYLRDYTETLSGDAAANTAISLTKEDVMLPRDNGGVFDVQFTHGGSTHYCELTSRDLFKRALNARYDTLGVQGYYLATHYAESLYVPIGLSSGDVITYSILPRFSTLSDGDEILLPVGAEEVLADRVLDTMRLIPPVDLMNDNAD